MEEIIEYENTLRRSIISLIGSSDESNYKVSEERIEKWKEKREIQRKKDNDILYESRIIYYSEFHDLESIIKKNWELFKPILKDKKRFEVYFKQILDFRNTVAHGRILNLSQQKLISGILGDLKNQITIYHNKNEMKEDYFIEIIQISDNLGNVWADLDSNRPILRVGDVYELIVEANDPKDREIEYKIGDIDAVVKIVQKSNHFIIPITEAMIRSHIMLGVNAYTPDSGYENSAIKTISLTVLPKE